MREMPTKPVRANQSLYVGGFVLLKESEVTNDEKKKLIQFHKTMALLLQQELDSVGQVVNDAPATQMPIGVPLLEIKEVLAVLKVSKSHWYDGIKEGRYPSPVKIGPRKVAWRTSDITKLINSFESKRQ